MAKPVYNKPALTIQDQAKLLFSRNLSGIKNDDLQKELERTSYYRISGYSFPYQDKQNNDQFIVKTAWKYIKSDYVLDASLRHLLFEAIGLIEITLRTQLIYQMSIVHGANWYSNVNLFRDSSKLTADHNDLLKNWNRSSDLFVNHYKNTYDTIKEPPAWMIFETTTFGSLSRYFENIKIKDAGKNAICNYWHVTDRKDYPVFSNWLKNMLSICAPEFKFERKLKTILKYATPKQLAVMGLHKDWKKGFKK